MNRRTLIPLFVLCLPCHLGAQNAIPTERLEDAALRFAEKIEEATEALAATRNRVAEEKQSLVSQLSASENRLAALQAELESIAAINRDIAGERELEESRLTGLRENQSYLTSSLSESLRTAANGMSELHAEIEQRAQGLSNRLLDPNPNVHDALIESLEILESQFRASLGGRLSRGQAANAESRTVESGAFLEFGPAIYFLAENTGQAALVRFEEDSDLPVAVPLPEPIPNDSVQRLVSGEQLRISVDPTNRDALRLAAASGTLWEHIEKGGKVGYIIIALGLFAFATAVLKLVDQTKRSVEPPAKIESTLALLSQKKVSAFAQMLESLSGSTRRLFQVGLEHLRQPQAVLEERLYANLLLHRLEHERKLPQLRVIAASAPLLGLLGTVVGMVKTFTLITIHGSGNAEKLSSGISQALVTTELGLIVAIPTLVAYGFLSQKAHRNLALLEQYASAFVAAVREEPDPQEPSEPT